MIKALTLQISQKHRFLKWCFCLFVLLFTNQAMALYTFPGALPPGCAGSAGVYTCSALNLQDHVQFNDTGNVTITVNGDLTFGGYTFGSATDAANVTFKANGNVYISFPTIYANIDSGIYSINISASPAIYGNLTSTSGIISAKGTINGNVSSSTGYIALNDKTTVSGNVSSTTGAIYVYNNSTVGSAVSSTSGNITLFGNNTISSSISCSTCQLTVYNGNNKVVGAVSVGILDDTAGSAASAGTIYSSAITTLTGNAYVGYYATVTGNVSAFNSVVIRDHASVTGNITSNNDSEIRYYSTITGSITTNATSATTVNILDYSTIYGNIIAKTTGSLSTSHIYLSYNTTINGDVNSSSPYASYIDVYNTSTLNGNITGFGGSLSYVNIWGTINGNVKSTATNVADGDIYLWYNSTKVNGSLYVSGDIYNYGTVTGCAQTTKASTLLDPNNVYLYSGSSTAGTCQGTSACTSDLTYVYKDFFVTMPPICSLPAIKIASYSMDETTWNGTAGEVLDSSGNNYHATAKIKSGTALPSTASVTRAIAGTTGTCGYGIFSGSQFIDVPPSFPNLTNNMTLAAWIYPTNINVYSQRIIADDQTNKGGYALSLSNVSTISNFGKIDFFKRNPSGFTSLINSNIALQNNNWYFVAVTTTSVTGEVALYIFNQAGALLEKKTSSIQYLSDSDGGSVSVGGENATSTEAKGFIGNIDEVSIYIGTLSDTQIAALATATHSCPTYISNIAASKFNCVATGTNASTGTLYTQLAGTAFNFDVVALKTDNSVETSFAAASNQDVTVELVNGVGTTACASRASLSPALSQTVTFSAANAGRKAVAATVTNANRDIRCRVTDANQSPSVVACSTDDFAVRPASFTVTSNNANADSAGVSASATPTFKAGAGFNLTATTGVVGYDGTPSIDNSKLNAHSGAIQLGSLSGGFSTASLATGSATGNAFNYSEVGYFNFAANGVFDSTFTSVDAANGDCVAGFVSSGGKYGCSFGNATATNYFGRFIPDHFSLSTGSTTPACSTSAVSTERFTYLGQDGFSTNFTLNAQNSSNQTIQNYVGSFAKFALTSWANYTFKANGLPAGTTLSASATPPTGTWNNGSASVVAKHIVTRPSTPVAGGNISISTTPTDSDGVTMPLTYVSSSSLFRYGRLSVPNTYGSELLPLFVPIEAQYWNGTAYQRNQLDVCTTINPSNISMSNYKNNLNACETQLTSKLPPTMTMIKGLTTAKLSAPGNSNNGSVDLTLNLGSVAAAPNNKTCSSATETSATATGFSWFGNSPSSRATFGIYKTPTIYLRENFNIP